jgi:hypothetical protein
MIHRIALGLACLFSVMQGVATCQPCNIQISAPGTYPEEVSIAINPKNPDELVAGANIRLAYRSTDGGYTWSSQSLPGETYGDPCLIFDGDGHAFFAHLTTGWAYITVRRSSDAGLTWSAGAKLPGPSSDSAKPGSLFRSSLQDKEWLIADMTGGPYSGSIYASWTDFTKYGSSSPRDSSVIVFARSTDHGVTFEKFVRVSDIAGDAIDSDNTMEGAVPAVGSNGEVYISWSGPGGLYFDRSFDGGRTWGRDTLLTALPGGWDFEISGISRCNGLPVTLADISNAPSKGNVYINWVDERNGDPDVFIIRSTDRGDTWSAPIRVNTDKVGNGKAQFFTWATVDPVTGELSVVFYDRRAYDSDSTDVYLARSTDGGRTFTNECISDSVFVPTATEFFGDYNCIAAYNGHIRPIWTRLNKGELSIHTAIIDPPAAGGDAPPSPSGGFLLEAFPNPLTALTGYKTTIRLRTDQPGTLHLSIHDETGRELARVSDRWCERGDVTVPLNAESLAPGSYVLRAEFSGAGRPPIRRTTSHTFTLLR